MSKKVTLKSIAEHFGVCIATVSRAISGHDYVREDLRRRILEYVEDTGIRREQISHNGGSRSVVIAAGAYYLEQETTGSRGLLRSLIEQLYAKGFSPLAMFGHRHESLARCLADPPDTVVIFGVNDRIVTQIRLLVSAGVKVIAIGDAQEDCGCARVTYDHVSAAAAAARDLKNNGARKVAFLAGLGPQKHPSDITKAGNEAAADIVKGIRRVFPAFDYTRDAVSDCYGDFSECEEMLISGGCRDWIIQGQNMLEGFARCLSFLPLAEQEKVNVSVLLQDAEHRIYPVCRRCYVQSEPVSKVVELIEKGLVDPKKPVTYVLKYRNLK